MAMTVAERAKRKRDKKKAEGRVKVELYPVAANAPKIRALAEKLEMEYLVNKIGETLEK